jgi:acetyl esterase/lipase
MRENSATYGIDPERIATFGYSSWGYLAALVALDDGAAQEHVRAIVAGGAPFDLSFYPGGNVIPTYLGGTQQQVPEKFWEASPVNFVLPNSPPIFMYQGTHDRLVKPEHALRMKSIYEREGAHYKLRWMEGNGHISAFLLSRPLVDEAIDFLDREMKPLGSERTGEL